MRIVIGGASGLIGTALGRSLETDGHDVVRLVRRPARGAGEAEWDPLAGVLDPAVLSGADAVVNLSGASLGKLPWTAAYRSTILWSRLSATRTLVDAMNRAEQPPAAFLSGSAVGYYGDRPGETLTEDSSRGTGFLADVVVAWEDSALAAPDAVRTVLLRNGIVVDLAGVLKPLAPLTRFGVAGPLGSGRQFWPWIGLQDEVRAITHLLTSTLSGPVNLCGPQAARADDLMFELARRMNRPYLLRVPKFALKALLGDAADGLLLSDQRVEPRRLLDDGFTFSTPTVEQALAEALARD
ncbi:TIGR01777 family protein [Plantibacter sp. VKM Ac-2885]|uniref:TIGR01777 family oxidoreductase n=1 Tax=Plantibacter TaxID=190323 RepID=UPI0010C19276|nr:MULTISPECIES: TIGR01777 family oxidoreductase [Plantibacter]MBD8103304.1 TIGR01777 family protein [Plantibacter sp. CFBP 8775]MBD8516841.1 TIGR01777 family protein [Plantibacter sp. CFBP 8804]MBD8536564.1 TIGR01777 family protein [Plantibacter sp. CFBP 13570]MBF4514642.1 TIGR01777 family protein [Plantibacter sp. VKM Ac-2885]TKJ96297.1 TIGR01777 family protein [Plantibacter flavus]